MNGRPVVRLAVLGAAALVAACDGGYPSEDAPPFEPHGMSRAERLAALNDAGGREGSELQWRYTLDSGCTLEIERRSGWGRRHGERVALAAAEPRLVSDDEARSHRVQLVGADGAAAMAFQTSDRIDALQVELLLTLLRRDCTADAAAASSAVGR